MRRSVGLDFGTTNSAIGVVDDDGRVRLARFAHAGGLADTFRSVLYFHPEARDARRQMTAIAGTRAIDAYLEADGHGRLVQSLKSYLADRGFEKTNVFGRVYTLSDLLSFMARAIRAEAEKELGPLGRRIVVGRPVHFSSGHGEDDDAFATGRLRRAIEAAGFEEVVFQYEPVGAAHYYESRLDHDELVIIGDFGGGTSDFSLLEVGPKARAAGARRILGHDGVGLAGDALDARILHHVVSPALGLGASYRSMEGKELPVPVWLFAKLRKWHLLSFLRTPRTLAMLQEIAAQTDEPTKIRSLLHVVEADLGYHLYRAVERAKVELSTRDEVVFSFVDDPVSVERTITRAEFESWIAEEVAAMAAAVDRLLSRAGVDAKDVDRVFLTGGTSFVPAVRAIFDTRFGAAKIEAGGEMISVATGLALSAGELSA